MKRNVGSLDRSGRVLLGIALLAFTALFDGPERWFGLIGIIALGTAALGFCPLYALLGLNSCGLTHRDA